MSSRAILAVSASLLAGFAIAILAGSSSAEAGGLIAPPRVCPDQSTFKHQTKARRSMICLTNYTRRKKGLRHYRVRPKLTWSATRKAADILRCNAFSHGACGREFVYWFKASRYTGRGSWSAGENIAWGSGGYGNSRAIFRAWMKSPGHRRAILDRRYRDLGVGVKMGKLSGVRGARVWVQHFGRRG